MTVSQKLGAGRVFSLAPQANTARVAETEGGLAQQRLRKSPPRIFVKVPCIKDFRRFRNFANGTCLVGPFWGA